MAAHVLDHAIFTSRRLTEKTKWIVFGAVAFSIVACFWWFKGVAFGIDGPINDHWGLLWRKVRTVAFVPSQFANIGIRRAGIFTICSRYTWTLHLRYL
jgi:hypothetical protein